MKTIKQKEARCPKCGQWFLIQGEFLSIPCFNCGKQIEIIETTEWRITSEYSGRHRLSAEESAVTSVCADCGGHGWYSGTNARDEQIQVQCQNCFGSIK
jgi:predicted RNA-binding Zn-ribbon protein involved in translation (DUF1610 family)